MRHAGDIFRDDVDSTAYWDAGNLSTLERDYGDQASVTIVPNGGDQFRVYEKNDGDPTLYTAHPSNPHRGKAVRTGEAYRNPLGTDPITQIKTKASELFGYAQADGQTIGVPVRYTSQGEYNPNALSYAGQQSHDQYMTDKSNMQADKWRAGTNSYVTGVEGVKDLARRGRNF